MGASIVRVVLSAVHADVETVVLFRRYAKTVAGLRDVFSEYALVKYRVLVEVRWLQVRTWSCSRLAFRHPVAGEGGWPSI